MNAPDIFGPRPSRQMRQPKKDVLREQLALAADEIISLRQRLTAFCEPDAPYRVTTIRTGHGRLTKHQQEAKVHGLLLTIRRLLGRAA